MRRAALVLAIALTASPAFAQLGGALGKLNKAKEQADKVKDLKLSEKDERAIGEKVSAQMIERFGVYQDAEVTKYVALVGTVLAQASSRPNLDWQFIVLDTDGVNAFAAPGGIVHIITNIGNISPEIPGQNYADCTVNKTLRNNRSTALISVDGNNLSAKIIENDGTELDSFTIAK